MLTSLETDVKKSRNKAFVKSSLKNTKKNIKTQRVDGSRICKIRTDKEQKADRKVLRMDKHHLVEDNSQLIPKDKLTKYKTKKTAKSSTIKYSVLTKDDFKPKTKRKKPELTADSNLTTTKDFEKPDEILLATKSKEWFDSLNLHDLEQTLFSAENVGVNGPSKGKRSVGNLITSEPNVGQRTVSKPSVGKPITSKPNVGKLSVSKPSVGNPITSEPNVGQRTVSKPSVGNPINSKPNVSKPSDVNPSISKPSVGSPSKGKRSVGISNTGVNQNKKRSWTSQSLPQDLNPHIDSKNKSSRRQALKVKLKQVLKQNREPLKTDGNKLRERMLSRLKAGQFRYLNERLYVSEGAAARELFERDPDAFRLYHAGFQQQVAKWPLNPLDVIIKQIRKMPATTRVADLGCGEAALARAVPQCVRSLDLVAGAPGVEACDMARTPLLAGACDVAVYCLALMGTNLRDYLIEANRILAVGGQMKIAEVESRFEDVEGFTRTVELFGFKLLKLDCQHQLFYFMDFKKLRDLGAKRNKLPQVSLKPCYYKKR